MKVVVFARMHREQARIGFVSAKQYTLGILQKFKDTWEKEQARCKWSRGLDTM